MVAGLHDRGPQDEVPPAAALGHLDLVHVEAELVQTADPSLDVVAVLGADRLRGRELGPQPAVAELQLLGDLDRVGAVQTEFRLHVEQPAGDVLDGGLDVSLALAVGELRMPLARLGVHEVGGQGARITAEQRVGERAVPPPETGSMQSHQQVHQGVQQPVRQRGQIAAETPTVPEDAAVGQREVEMTGHEDVVELGAPHHGDGLHRRERLVTEPAQQPVLALREVAGQLLQRVQGAPVVHEPHHVAVQTAHHLREAVHLPLTERLAPRQVEEVGVAGACDDPQRRRGAGHGRTLRSGWRGHHHRFTRTAVGNNWGMSSTPGPDPSSDELSWMEDQMSARRGRAELDAMLEQCERLLVGSGQQVATSVVPLTEAFLEGDSYGASEIAKNELDVSGMTTELEDTCYLVLARQAPVAGDLRHVVSMMRCVQDVQRSANLLRHVASTLTWVHPPAMNEALRTTIRQLGTTSADIFTGGVAAWERHDGLAAPELEHHDDQVDLLQKHLLVELYTGQQSVEEAVSLALIARYFERVADHGVELARQYAYVRTGERVGETHADAGDH